jgi:hypothetical protein
MKHIRTSIKGIFLLENEGEPTSLVTSFGENIPDGSICIDIISTNIFKLKDSTWILILDDIKNIDSILSNDTPLNVNGVITDRKVFVWSSPETTGTPIQSPDLPMTNVSNNQYLSYSFKIFDNTGGSIGTILYRRDGSNNLTLEETIFNESILGSNIQTVINISTNSLRLQKGGTQPAFDVVVTYEVTKFLS